jgi:hypothetical protein
VLEAVCKAEIGDNDVAVAIEKVLEFEVAVDNLLLVYVPDT